jgi:N-acetylglucosaminyl-diphospho-decaprenol L-rhamnosyltransferase
MAGPALAVVVVTYNSADHVGRTLAAVEDQLEDGDELVVVDNDSVDGTVEAARAAAPRARVLAQERNLGFTGGCHVGAASTAAPLLLFLNPDAVPERGCLSVLRATAADRPGWGAWQAIVTLPGGERLNTRGGVVHWLGMGWAGGCGEPAPPPEAAPREVAFPSGAALAVRRAAWEAAGGFAPEYFAYGEDLDLGLRLWLAGSGVGAVPGARVSHDYDFEKGAYKWFLLERNRWWTLLADYPTALLALVAPALVAAELALLAVAARGGWLRAKLRAQAAVARSLPWALARRRRVQAARRVGAAEFAGRLTAALDSDFLPALAAHGGLARAQAAYWRAVVRTLQAIERG